MAQLSTLSKKYRTPDIGSMNSRLFIYDRDIAPPVGVDVNFTETFTAKLACWALVETPKGVSMFDQSNVERVVTHKFTIRNVPYAARINEGVFVGAGLNDLTSSGTYTFTSKLVYRVQIFSIGAIDAFKWSIDGGTTWSIAVPITGAAQSLSNGMAITFSAVTGHKVGDYWDVVASAGIRLGSQDWIFYQNQFMGQQSIFDILSVEVLDEEGRYLTLLAALTGDQSVLANYA